MKIRSVAFLALCLAAGSVCAQLGGVPKPLLSKFHNGVNITRWFCYLDGSKDPIPHFKTYLNPKDFANFKELDIDYVRLCVSPEAIFDGGAIKAKNLPYLDAALATLKKHNLAVLLDLHDNGQLKLDQPGKDNSEFVAFWTAMARHYKGKDLNNVVFELLNEPMFQADPKPWFQLQQRTVSAIRQVDPKRTIMVSSNMWSGIDAIKALNPLPQTNLIYTVHCYDPFYFTHQGASWVGPQPQSFKRVPFPSNPKAVEAILPANLPENANALRWYGEQRYDAAYLQQRIALAADYQRSHRVPVLLGEFGAYNLVTEPASRANWFRAMKKAVTKSGIPYCLWGYDDSLGLGRSDDGKATLDPVTLRAFYGIQR